MSSRVSPRAARRRRQRPEGGVPYRKYLPEQLGVPALARTAIAQVLREAEVRQRLTSLTSPDRVHHLLRTDDSTAGLLKALTEMVELANAGATPGALGLYVIAVETLHRRITLGGARRSLDTLDLESETVEQRDRLLALRRRVEGATPQALRDEAQQKRRDAALDLEMAEALEAEAAAMEHGARCTAVQVQQLAAMTPHAGQ